MELKEAIEILKGKKVEKEKLLNEVEKTNGMPITHVYEKTQLSSKLLVEIVTIETVLQALEELQKENELARKSLIENSNIADERNNLLVEAQRLKENSISKDKIKEKIVDLKVSQENTENDNLDRKYQYQIEILEELLKGE